MLAIDSYDYSPQFGQDDVAVLVKKMMSSLLYDNKNKVVNEGLYRHMPSALKHLADLLGEFELHQDSWPTIRQAALEKLPA
eukprot:SAG22_NODE_122_length_18920_cov_23.494076_26_plen_81_part_00